MMKWFRWRDRDHALKQLLDAMGDKNLPILAAGIAYFATLSFFPLMAAIVSVSALFVRPEQLQDIVVAANTYLPKDMASLITTQLANLIDKPAMSMVATGIALAIALWGIGGAVENLLRALNTAYDVKETRSFLRMKSISFAFTGGVILLLMVVVPMMGLTEEWMHNLGVSGQLVGVLSSVRWLVLIGLMMLALVVLYRYGPNHHQRAWRWMSWGAVIATVLWMIVTALFFVYARYFAHFSDSYSLFAGIVVLMIWFNLSALIVLVGAEVNHRLESKH